MVVIPGPVEFVMGSPLTEVGRSASEHPHRKRISRSFAVAAKPVTKEQFLRFHPDLRHDGRPINQSPSYVKFFPETSCPIGMVTWHEAAAYCNWLSEKEGIAPGQWCYEVTRPGGVFKATLKKNHLTLTGYRLPTEAEWEYATRARAVTSCYFGESEAFMSSYGWYVKNSKERTWPVGLLKPNDFGLFDMHGNILCWCQDRYQEYPEVAEGIVTEDEDEALAIDEQAFRAVRGGSFRSIPAYMRSADRDRSVPTPRVVDISLRPARTITPDP
jgi:formylglycine-generating enzyme required for sulfatase activity